MAAEPLWVPSKYASSLDDDVARALSLGRKGTAEASDEVKEMRLNRKANLHKQGISGTPSVNLATMRPRDPLFYWQQNNVPYEIDKDEELQKVRMYCRLMYLSHPLIASAIDIFSTYPLTGMEVTCKDSAITDFYTDLFMDQLNYEEFLVDVLRSYWTYGEAWPFGSFNETLGIWEDDELLHPDHIRVTKSPFSKEPRFEMQLPDTLRNLLKNHEPLWEYEKLIRAYPELAHYLSEEAWMPVSNVLLQQLMFKGDLFHPRGIPILMRGLRAVMQEEMLNAAQDAIADRLYTPLIHVKLGASASDLGTSAPWIPTESDIADFEASMDAALAGDFRILTHHFAVDIETVFGREAMPDFTADFDRLADRELQVFGLSKTMLSGAQGGETYAADALNLDLVSQRLSGAQRIVQRLFTQRARVVAEAQEHFDYEVRNGKRYPVMEEVLEIDEETGEQRIVEQPKLLIPELKIKTMNMKHETEYRQFIEAAVAANVPISQKTRFTNIPVDLDEERDKVTEEQVDNAIAEQETRRKTYLALKARRLPIDEALIKDFGPQAIEDPAVPTPTTPVTPDVPSEPISTLDPDQPHPSLIPAQTDIQAEQKEDVGSAVTKLPRNQIMKQPHRPPESDEQRKGMPTAAHLDNVVPIIRTADDEPVLDDEGHPLYGTLTHGPQHIGLRRYSMVRPDVPLED